MMKIKKILSGILTIMLMCAVNGFGQTQNYYFVHCYTDSCERTECSASADSFYMKFSIAGRITKLRQYPINEGRYRDLRPLFSISEDELKALHNFCAKLQGTQSAAYFFDRQTKDRKSVRYDIKDISGVKYPRKYRKYIKALRLSELIAIGR